MMTDKPLVSVIIAVRNGERFLGAAIESVLAQDYRPLEIIVVDGQSVDRTEEIAKSFEEIRYIRQVGRGVADAYNVGIDAASGELIAFLSHDDLWTPNKLRVQVTYMIDHPEIQYTIARVKFFMESGLPIPPGFRRGLLENDHVGRIMETLVARRAAFDVVGRFDVTVKKSEDVDWFARAKDMSVPVATMPEILLLKRVHDANVTYTAIEEGNQSLLRILRESIRRQRSHKPVPRNGGPDNWTDHSDR